METINQPGHKAMLRLCAESFELLLFGRNSVLPFSWEVRTFVSLHFDFGGQMSAHHTPDGGATVGGKQSGYRKRTT